MLKRDLLVMLLVSIYILFTVTPLQAQLPQISSGLNYLASSQTMDGTWASSTPQVETTAATFRVLETLKLLNQTSSTSYVSGAAWLQGQSPQSVDYIAERIVALNLTDGSVEALIPALDSLKGAWSGYDGYEANNLDTVLALKALKAVNYSNISVLNAALAYITTGQNTDGGWGFYRGDASNVYMTALVSATLQQFPQMTTIATAVSKATSYLVAHQNTDGGFGSSPSTVYETALAYAALAGDGQTQGLPLQNAINYLIANQSANGSWNDDPYSTALALKALYYSENKPSPPPPPPAGGKITGTVIDATTKQKVSGVAVVLESNSLFNSTTDSSGNFTLTDVPPGAQKVNFALSGYLSTTASTTVVEGGVISLGNIPMLSSYSTGTITGTVTDSTGKPLSGVAVSVSGAWSGNAATGADGSFSFIYVTPGSVTITAAKSGYQTVTGTGTVYARTTLSFSPRMSTTPSQATTGTLVGRVVDSYWGVPIGHLPEEEGVTVRIAGLKVEPDDNGYFTIPDLAPNTYQVLVGMNGFIGRTFTAIITAGGITDLGTIRLTMTASHMTLTGKVTDTSTGTPIPGAEVAITGTDFVGRTDFSGTYVTTGIPTPGTYTLKVSAAGYVGKSYTIGSAPWTQTMDIKLSPQVTKGSLTGTIVDASSNLPLSGVTLALVSDPSITTATDNTGMFTLNAIPKGIQQVTLAANGYASRTMTAVVTAGAVSDVGQLALSATELPASIQGRATKAGADAPFAGVTIQAIGADTLQTVTAGDGTYRFDAVPPGTVTVSATALNNPDFTKARLTATLAQGGILIFNPALSLMLSGTCDVTVKTDKALYGTGDTVGITTNLKNRQAEDMVAALHVQVVDPSGTTVYETSMDVDLAADAAVDQSLNFNLPSTALSGRYTVVADAYDVVGTMASSSYKYFDVTVSQISITPTLPPAFSVGTNGISFSLTNTGTLPVANGDLSVTLRGPDGQAVSTTSQSFNLGLGESKILNLSLSVPVLKFGTYTLSYIQRDETKAGQATEVLLPSSVAVKGLFDSSSRRIRETANLTVTVSNTGKFNLDSTGSGIAVTVSVPDAGYSETKTLQKTSPPIGGEEVGTALLYSFTIPETLTAGQHAAMITVTLPSSSEVIQKTYLTIPDSSLSQSIPKAAYSAGETIRPVISNTGGVDTPVQYKLSLYDAKSALIAETSNTETALAGSSISPSITIPIGAVDGPYNLVINYKDTKTGKEGITPNAITVSGVKGSLQVATDKQTYLKSENITGFSTITNSGTALQGGNLHLQVVTAAGSQKQKTWTTQADFQAGVRSGVDTYGVNDWIVPDDDFDGTVIDTNKWSSGGNVSIRSGRLFSDTTQATSSSSIESRWSLEGDFDIQVDFISNASMDWVGAQLFISINSSWVNIGNYKATGYASQISVDGSYITGGNSSTSGRFRITRTGNKIVTYYWGGTSWIQLNSSTSSILANPARVGLGIWRATGYPGATAEFDNFKVNSGRIKTENQTVDSVRLLPLNDNFDGTSLNEDRWNFGGPKPPVNSGAAHLLSTATSPTNTLRHRNSLQGDFSAVSIFNNYAALPKLTNYGRYIMNASVGNSSFYINRQSNDLSRGGGEHIVSLSQINNVWQMTSDVPYSSGSGEFRLRREGSTAFTDYWNGTSWINQHSRSAIPSDLSNISLYTYSQEGLPTVQVDIDKFFTNKGAYSDKGTIILRQDSGKESTHWGKITYTTIQPTGTSIKFRTRTSEIEAGLSTAIWSDYITASGSAISSPAARWIEMEATLATTNTNVTPLLHDVTVTYEANPGEVLWQTDLPANLAQDASSDLTSAIGTLGVTGKLYLQGTLNSSTGQAVASAEYPFYVEQGNFQLLLAPDKKVYRPGEIVTISGELKNLTSVEAAGVALQVKDAAGGVLYNETFNLPANSSHPFSFTTTAGQDGTYRFTGAALQNGITLAEIGDQYETGSPALTATISAPDTVGNDPFNLTLSISNTGKIDATTTVRITDDGGETIDTQNLSIPAGETRLLQYTRQIMGSTTYTAAFTEDVNQTLTKVVAYTPLYSDQTVGISGKIVTDKVSYNPNDQVALVSTITATIMQENLTALITVTDGQGRALFSTSTTVPTVVPGQQSTIKTYWNVGTNPAGTYLVTLQIRDAAGTVISKSTCNLVISSTTKPTALLKGQITLDKQSILSGEPVTVSYSITNAGNIDLSNIPISIQTVHMVEETVYNTITDQAAILAIGAAYAKTGRIDTQNYGAKDYLVVLRATIDGVEETLAGTYFRVEGAPSAPALSAPTNGADVETLMPMLSVSNAADPNNDRLRYEFEIYTDSGLTQRLTSGTVSEAAGITGWTVPAALTENKTYYWRARAYDGKLYGPWMTSSSFRVNTANDPPSPPGVSSPADGGTVAVLKPVLSVTNASDPDSASLTYNFQVATDPGFTDIVASGNGIPSGEGTTSWEVPVSLTENQTYYWRAQADDWLDEGPWMNAARFFVNTANDAPAVPVITSPVNGSEVTTLAPEITVTNSTDPDSSAVTYVFEVDTVPTFDSANVIRSGSIQEGEGRTSWNVTGLADNTFYYARAKASDGVADSDWSQVIAFFANTKNDAPTTPVLANPSNGSGINVFTPTLSVHNATDVDKDSLTYELEVYADAALTNLVASATAVAETASVTSWTVAVSLSENQTYYWRARAYDGELYSAWMPVASFMINTANDAPSAPTLSAPVEGSSIATLYPTLTVVNATDPDSAKLAYEFQVYSGDVVVSTVAGVTEDSSGATSVTLTSPLADNTSYRWRARAYDGDSYGPWMDMASFMIHVPVNSINATVDFDPNTLNSTSQGKWVVVYIELPEGHDPAAVDVSSVRLEGTVAAEPWPYAVGDYDRDGIRDLMVKFKRNEVIGILPRGEKVPVHVSGKAGTLMFQGVDTINVLN